MASGIELQGFDEFLTLLNQMGEETSPVIQQAVAAAAQEFAKDVKPKIKLSDIHRLPGGNKNRWRDDKHVQDCITSSEALGKDGNFFALAGVSKSNMKAHWYIRLLEYGTYKMTAQAPFARTMAINKSKYEEIFSNKLKEGLKL
jgi:HK97 gp10 family phage protein